MPVKNIVNDDLYSTPWLGEVVDIEDPQKIGRIKVKVFGKFDLLTPEDIPWAYPANNVTAGSDSGGGFFSVPKLGSIVSVKFDNGNLYHPEYYYVQKLSNEAKAEIENSYENAHIIVYDTITEGFLKIFFTEEKGLMFDYQESQINIKNDKSIVIQTASGDSVIEMLDDGTLNITHANMINITSEADVNVKCENVNVEANADVNIKCQNAIIDHAGSIELGKGAFEPAVLGDQMTALFNSHTHIGNMGAPTSPPMAPMGAPQLSAVNVKVK
jgi:hypothetical protein